MIRRALTAIAGAVIISATACGPASADSAYHEHTESPEYTIDVTYPLGYPDGKAVSDFVHADRAEFVDWVNEVGAGMRDRPYTYTVTAKTYRSTRYSTTSLVLSIDDDTGAAHEAHPARSYRAFNFDLATREPITFETLFKPDARPLGLPPSDCRNFALTNDAVIFFFGEGQLTSADNTGPRHIAVPRSELVPLMA